MMRKPGQMAAILLSLLLVLLPMQSAIAGMMSFDRPDDRVSHSLMDMEHHASMPDCDECSHCSINNTCDENDCSSGHCATCVAGIPVDSTASLKISSSLENPVLYHSVSIAFIRSLYRPPRA
ncbi:MAG: hypothetical protein HKP55_02765 [Gammaproteobacteria bacterium]|nr:hypothetical protein [Gammaproteobacteria bacterium]NNJ90574.1 hypothetical protein [Gammaproteobacteria bacterium]